MILLCAEHPDKQRHSPDVSTALQIFDNRFWCRAAITFLMVPNGAEPIVTIELRKPPE